MSERSDTTYHWQRAGAVTWDWVWPIAVVATGLWLAAPRIEAALWPILGKQALVDVIRTPGRLCWERVSEKFRIADVDNYDVFMDRRSMSGQIVRNFPEIFIEATGEPIATDKAPGVGWSRRRLCVLLPPDVRPDQSLRLRQTVHFRGLLNLWDVPVPLPEIVSPEGASQP